MNSLNLTYLGGVPLTQRDIKWLQDNYSGALSSLSIVIGDKVILAGMVEAGGNVSNGWISLNGELLPFVGGAIGTGEFAIVETPTNRVFHDGNAKPVRIDRVATFSTGGAYQYSDLVRVGTVKEMWQAGDIKQITCNTAYIADNFDVTGKGINKRVGWAICNGNNETADLRGKFLVGYNPAEIDYNEAGKTGGEKTHVLTVNEIPAHTHSFGWKKGQADQNESGTFGELYDNAAAHNRTTTTSSVGGGQPHENRPPYYTVLFIQKL